MSTLADHIQRLCLFRRLIQPGDNAALLLEDQEFRKEALVLCSVHLDELAALAVQQAAATEPSEGEAERQMGLRVITDCERFAFNCGWRAALAADQKGESDHG